MMNNKFKFWYKFFSSVFMFIFSNSKIKNNLAFYTNKFQF